MRDPNRIHSICEKIEKVWNIYPDMRFFQLVINLASLLDTPDAWFIEDDTFEKLLDEFEGF